MDSPSTLPAILIASLAAVCAALVVTGLRTGLKRSGASATKRRRTLTIAVAGIALWALVVGLLAHGGFFSNFTVLPPRLLFALVLPAVALAAALIGSETFRQAIRSIPIAWLLYLQVFRVVVELILWRGYKLGLIPVQMTFDGRNFDILAGLTAPLAGWLWQRTHHRLAAVAWNLAGLALLANIVVVAILSMPTPLRVFTEGPANTLLTQFPFIYLPAILVPVAYTAHILSLLQLMASIQNDGPTVEAAGPK